MFFKKLIISGLFFFLCSGLVVATDIPSVRISNGLIKAKLFLPDKTNGYYRGTRFDWSGVIPELEYKGHHFFGQWFPVYNPTLHDAIMGPVEEFSVLSYNEAAIGAGFLKIGVGILIKPDDKPYSFARTYEIRNGGKWKVKKKKDRIEFTHELTDAGGYAYRYKKIVRLVRGKPEMVLEHSLKNTGRKSIETSVYNHNFFVIDNEPTNENIKMSFPFEVRAEGRGFGTTALAKNKSVTYTKPLAKGESIFSAGLKGIGNTAEDYDITIQNLKSGAGVRITSDQPIDKLVYWACSTTACPEPYIKLAVKAGETIKWRINYEFSAANPAL